MTPLWKGTFCHDTGTDIPVEQYFTKSSLKSQHFCEQHLSKPNMVSIDFTMVNHVSRSQTLFSKIEKFSKFVTARLPAIFRSELQSTVSCRPPRPTLSKTLGKGCFFANNSLWTVLPVEDFRTIQPGYHPVNLLIRCPWSVDDLKYRQAHGWWVVCLVERSTVRQLAGCGHVIVYK